MRPPIDDATVLLTGASSGIGREMARQLAPRVRRLVLVARRRDRLEALAAELTGARPALRVDVRPCDLSDPDDTRALADELAGEGVDVLINNAGLGSVELFERVEWDKLDQLLMVNVHALTLLTHALLPGMLLRKRGGILNVSSGFGLSWMPVVAVYAASKHYVTAFSEALRAELTGTGVVVSQVCPGPVDTEFERIAGNPTSMNVPRLVQLTPAVAARVALRAFERGRALVVPGWPVRLLLLLGAASPRWLLRLVYRWMGPTLRRAPQRRPAMR